LQLYETKRGDLIQFLSVSQGVGDVGVLRGILFERHAHTVIANGGVFQIRQLLDSTLTPQDSDTPREIQLPRVPQLVFDNDEHVRSVDGFYFRPLVFNYESVDSFEKPNALFQMTGAKKHPCKQVGIHNVLNLLDQPINPSLFFVVPKDRFANFKYQKYEDSNGKPMKEPTYANVKKVKQFVLAIELTSSQ
jgi:hypothetical protein